MKFFNTAGPVNPEDHYCLPLAARLDEQELRVLIEQKKYFIMHAPRQTGKTSTMLNFARRLNEEGIYTALYVNIEGGQALRGNVEKALPIIIQEFQTRAKELLPPQDPVFEIFENLKKEQIPAGSLLNTFLSNWCAQSTKPIIIFIDEIDCLIGDTLISVLRQLRAGYDKRPRFFPQSVCLIGVRDVRDYRIWSEEQQAMILGGSAFNIKAKSLRLEDFTKDDVKKLYLQHTQETGQEFTDEAMEYAFEQTQGQPWLVNALAYQACFEMIKDRKQSITKDILETAKETLIKRQDTHIDVLVDKLKEPRVRHIIDAIIQGKDSLPNIVSDDDLKYVRDLGLVAQKELKIANPIYQDVLPRALIHVQQQGFLQQAIWYQNKDGSLDMRKLLEAFTQFYRENSAVWLEQFEYKESGPHLLMMAFLQRIINGGGKIHREYALGRKRVDLEIIWQKQRIVIELKLKRGQKYLEEGLEQTASYMDISNATEGHLVIFDRSETKGWDEKIYTRQEKVGSKTITIWGI